MGFAVSGERFTVLNKPKHGRLTHLSISSNREVDVRREAGDESCRH